MITIKTQPSLLPLCTQYTRSINSNNKVIKCGLDRVCRHICIKITECMCNIFTLKTEYNCKQIKREHLLSHLKVALASCSSRTASMFWSSITSACSVAFWSWLWMMKSSRRFAMSSSHSVTLSIPRRSSDSSWACW